LRLDPQIQRFISEDLIGFASGDFNFYRYVGNSSVNVVDPWGLATYKSVEGHYVLGAGLLEISCCTENGKGLKHLYIKVCLGVAVEVSGSIGMASNSDGKSCSNPPKNMLGGELGAGYGFGVEGSVAVDMGGSGASAAGGLDAGAGAVAMGVKATACYYRLVSTIPSDKKCECE